MYLKDLGEFGLIDQIKDRFKNMVVAGVEGIGDDCAVIPIDNTRSYVVTTDMLVEGKHFLLDKISPGELGYKSLAVNISDVASMGATPRFSLLSLSVHKESTSEWCEEFIKGYHKLSAEHNILLIGGDTTAADSGHMTISVTAIGEVENINIKRRNAAKVDDIIAVNTLLGDSSLALRMMLEGLTVEPSLMAKHNAPSPCVKDGIWFGTKESVGAMMDISDGISSDIRHICNLSGCGATIFTHALPSSDALKQRCREMNWNEYDFTLSGGEDYGLLMTINSSKFESLKREYFGTLYPIGVITSGCEVQYINSECKTVTQKLGFNHF